MKYNTDDYSTKRQIEVFGFSQREIDKENFLDRVVDNLWTLAALLILPACAAIGILISN